MMTKARASSYQGRSIRRGLGIFLVGCLVSFTVAGVVPPPVTSVAAGAALASPVNATNSATGFQSRHQVAVDGIGNSVVVWEDNASGSPSGWSIMGRCFDTTGTPLANAFQISSASASGAQRSPAVARNASGDFIVAWEDYNGSSNHLNHVIQARWFTGANVCNAVTAPLPFVVRTAGSEVHAPAVAMSAAGNAVIFWNDLNATPSGVITGAGYAKNATSASWLATIGATGLLYRPAVSADKAGNFVVAWAQGSNADLDIYMQGFTSAGSTLSGASTPILVNTTTTGVQDAPSVSMNAGGDFVVAWESDVSGKEVQAQRFHLNGVAQTIAAQGTELTAVLPATSHSQFVPSVAIDYAGNFWTAWQDVDSSGPGVSARWYNASTTTFDAATTRVNSTESNAQVLPSAAADADGDLLVAWTDQGADAASDDVLVRRFAGHESVDLSIGTSDAPQPALSGNTLSYTLTVTNNHALVNNAGASDTTIGTATGIVLTDTLPVSNATYVSASGLNWSCAGPSSGVVTCTYLGTLAPQATASVIVQVTPTAAGNVTNNVLVKGSQFDASFGNNALADSQSAAAAVYALSASPSSISFSDTNVGSDSAGTSITISNSGNAAITLSANAFTGSGSNPNDFSIVAGTNNCSGVTLAVSGAGSSCTVSFKFSPTSSGTRSADETVNTTQVQGTPLVIPLSGKGLQGVASFNPTSLDFGSQAIGTSSLPQAVTLTNTGNSSMTITSVAAGTGFSQDGTCSSGTVLLVGNSCEIDVSFVPASATSYSASLTVISSVGTSTVALSGSGIDQTPDSATAQFTAVTNAEVSTDYISNTITLSGMSAGANAPLIISNGLYSLNDGPFTSAATTVNNGNTLRIKITSSAAYSTRTTAALVIGPAQGALLSTAYSVTTRKAVTTPDALVFTSVNNAELNTVVDSNMVTVGGLETSVPITVSNATVSINGAPGVTSGTVKNTDTLVLHVQTGSSFNTRILASAIVGSGRGNFSVTTRAAQTAPNPAVAFTAVTNAPFLSQTYISNAATIQGLEIPVTMTVTGGTFKIGNSAPMTSGTVQNGDVVTIQLVSSGSTATRTVASVIIGTGRATFSVTTSKTAVLPPG